MKHERPIDFKNGLVDPNALLEYMTGCHCEAMGFPRVAHGTEYHHLYFSRAAFKKNRASFPLRSIRNSRYNQIRMLPCQEELYHRAVSEQVPQDQIDPQAAERFLEEAEWITDYASSSYLLSNAHIFLNGENDQAELPARIEEIEEMYCHDANNIARIEVVEPSIVIGALGEYVAQRHEARLEGFVQSGINEGIVPMPVKIYEENTLNHRAINRLGSKRRTGKWITQRIFNVPLVAEAA